MAVEGERIEDSRMRLRIVIAALAVSGCSVWRYATGQDEKFHVESRAEQYGREVVECEDECERAFPDAGRKIAACDDGCRMQAKHPEDGS